MKPAPRRKLPRAHLGVAPFLRGSGDRPVSASSAPRTRLPTVLALHAAMLVSGAALGMLACGSAESGDAIQADHHVRTVATSAKPPASASATPATMAEPFLDPQPHEVDGQRMVVVPPPPPSTTAPVITTTPTTAPTWKGPKMAGVRPPVRPLPTTTTGAPAGPAIGGTPPCPPPDPGATTT